MMSNWSGWRSAIVGAGWSISQRNCPPAVTHTLPVPVRGWERTLSERVWTKSPVQFCRFVWVANQRSTSALGSLQGDTFGTRTAKAQADIKSPRRRIGKTCVAVTKLQPRKTLVSTVLARWGQIGTIDRYPCESRVRMHEGFAE